MDIIAKTIDSSQFSYECPFCWSKYNKNGERSSRGKAVMHRHGSEGLLNNRVEYRGNHCKSENTNINIHITDETCRL